MSTGKVFFAMKNLHKILVVLFVLLNYSCATQGLISVQRGSDDSQLFYDQLSPYGDWVDNSDYGYVWIPDVNQDFSPYSTSGYWLMTQYGWTWVSDYSWGWAPFHYGRWDYNNSYGWFWVPDNEWGPSWVTWRAGNGYYGWTPMRPGMNIYLSFGPGYRDLDRWNFVRERDFGRSDIYRYYADKSDYNSIIINSRVINNTYVDQSRNTTYIAGPSRSEVQRVTGRRIRNITVRDNNRPGHVLNKSQLRIYRPLIQPNSDRSNRPSPSKITNVRDVRPPKDRNAPDQRSKVTPIENNRREQQPSKPQSQVERKRQSQRQQIERQNQQKQQQKANPVRQRKQQKQRVTEPSGTKKQERQQKATEAKTNDVRKGRRR